MNKKLRIILLLIIALSLFGGCSTRQSKFSFDDKKIKITKESIKKIPEGDIAYTLKLFNGTGKTVEHLELSVSYLIKLSNGTAGNPFNMELKPRSGNNEMIRPGESVVFHGVAPIKVFDASRVKIDVDDPYIWITGFVSDKNKSIPFSCSGYLSYWNER